VSSAAGSVRSRLAGCRRVVLHSDLNVPCRLLDHHADPGRFASFLLGIAALRPTVPHPSLADGTAAPAVVMTGAYLALTGLAGLGIGAILRHGAAAAATLVGGLLVRRDA
jgi:ABC-2 type transport system permease protein